MRQGRYVEQITAGVSTRRHHPCVPSTTEAVPLPRRALARGLLSWRLHAPRAPCRPAARPDLQAPRRRGDVERALRGGRRPGPRRDARTHALALQRAPCRGAFQGRARAWRPGQEAGRRWAHADRHLLAWSAETVISLRHVHPDRIPDGGAAGARLDGEGRRSPWPRTAREVAWIALDVDRLDGRVRCDGNGRRDRHGGGVRSGTEPARRAEVTVSRRGAVRSPAARHRPDPMDRMDSSPPATLARRPPDNQRARQTFQPDGPRCPSSDEVPGGGIEPPTRGFSGRVRVWPRPRDPDGRRRSRRGAEAELKQRHWEVGAKIRPTAARFRAE